jgi:hypothetical protein
VVHAGGIVQSFRATPPDGQIVLEFFDETERPAIISGLEMLQE